MRVLFTFIGGLGHFQPMVPVVEAVRAAGHELAVACSGARVGDVEAAGYRALPTSPVREPILTSRDLTPLKPVDAREAELEFATNFADKGARRHADQVQQRIREWRPDVIVRDEADLGTAIAAEVLGVPAATVLVLASGRLIRPDLVAEPLGRIRAEHGLPPDPGSTMLARPPVLSPFPPSFRSPDSPVPLPRGTAYFRPGPQPDPAPARDTGAATAAGIAPSARPRVYVTLGTVFNTGSGDLFERLLRAVADVDAEVLVTIGRDLDPGELGRQPAHVTVERFVPQPLALDHCDLVVSHGGSGSLLAGLAHAASAVLLPLGADQPHNAARAEALGLARVLDAATATPGDLRRGIEDALGDRAMRERVRRVSAEIAAQPPAADVVPLLEALVRSPDAG